MGGSASIESDICIIDADTNNIITKLRNVNLKKVTLADCRNKLIKLFNSFYFVDANGVRVLQDDEILLATEVMKSNTLDLRIKLEGTALDVNDSIDEIRSASSTATADNNTPIATLSSEIADKSDAFDEVQEEVNTRREQANILLGTSNVDHTINEIWGALNPPKEVQQLLSIAMVGIEFTAEFVPGARTFVSVCADVYATFQACDKLNKEVIDAKGFVIDITKLIIRVNESKTFEKDFPKEEVHDCLKRLSTLITNINNQSKNKFSKWFHARTNIEELQSLKQELEDVLLKANLPLTLALNDYVKVLEDKMHLRFEGIHDELEAIKLLNSDNHLKEEVMKKLQLTDYEFHLLNQRMDVMEINLHEQGMEVAELRRVVELSRVDNRESLETAFQQNAPLNFGPLIDEYVNRFLDGTRQWAFDDFDTFMNDTNNDSRIRIFAAGAGVGKTGIMSKLVSTRKNILAYFFCRHDDSLKRDPKRLIMNIALQISVAPNMKDYRKKLEDMQLTRVSLSEMNLISLFTQILVEPLNAISANKEMQPKAILIDALDECIHNDTNGILRCISQYFTKLPSWIKVMVTTRPEVPIMKELNRLKPTLLEPSETKNLSDLQLYFEYVLKDKMKNKDIEIDAAQLLVKKSGGVFVYASKVAIRFDEMETVTQKNIESCPDGIFDFYQEQFDRYIDGNTNSNVFKAIEYITISPEPLQEEALQMLLQIGKGECRTIINLLSGFFPVRDHRIHVYHKSITDWLLDQAYQGSERIPNESIYVIDVEEVQERICQRCFDLINNNNVLLTKDYMKHKQGLKYAIKYMIYHYLHLNKLSEARQVLLRHDWIIVRALVGESYNMYQDYCRYLQLYLHENQKRDNTIYYITACLRLGLPGLAKNPQQICGQIVGRTINIRKREKEEQDNINKSTTSSNIYF